MDNTVPASQQRPTQQPVSNPVVDVKPPDDTDDDSNQTAPAKGYSPNKEFAPVASVSPSEMGGQPEEEDDEDEDKPKVARQEVMLSTKVAPVQEVPVSQELKEIGVEHGSDTPKEIPVVVQQAGMRVHQPESAIPVSVTGSVKIPITYEHAVQLDKRSKIKESIKWLARLIKHQWQRVRFMEKHKDKKLEELSYEV